MIRAIEAAGGRASVARHFNISREAVYQWTRVPPERVVGLSQISGVPCHELRPDLYPAKLFRPFNSLRKFFRSAPTERFDDLK